MTDQQPAAKKGGRPSKSPGGGKSPTITFRCRKDLQLAIQQKAGESGRSVSEEIERQLEKALQLDDIISQAKSTAKDEAIAASVAYFNALNGGPDLSKFGRTMSSALRFAMMVNGLSGTKYIDIQNDKAKFDSVNDYVTKCVTEELLNGNAWDGADMHAVGIRSNLTSAENGDAWPKEPDYAAERAYYANQITPGREK